MPSRAGTAVLTPRPVAVAESTAYDAWLGPLRFVTISGQPTETLGDGLEAVGAALTAAERRPRAFSLTIPVRAHRSEADPHAAGLALRRQVRQLLENRAWTGTGLHFWFGPDPDLEGWLLVGGGDLKYTQAGIGFADFSLELTDCYLVGRPGTHRPARRLEIADRRTGTVAHDTRGTIFSAEHATTPPLARPLLVPGDTVRLTGARRRPLDVTSVAGPTVGARRLWREVPTVPGDVVDFLPDRAALPDPSLARRDLDAPGSVRVWDVSSGIPVTSTGAAQDADPSAGYGWERVVGQPLDPDVLLAVENGWTRIIPARSGRVRLERMNADTGRYVAVGEILIGEPILDVQALAVTSESATIALRTAHLEHRVILQRGWDGPRWEAYYDAAGVTGAAQVAFMPAAGQGYTATAATPSWVHAVDLQDGGHLLLAPAVPGSVLDTQIIDLQPTLIVTGPASADPSALVLQITLGLPGEGVDAAGVAARALADVRCIPTLVAVS